MPKAILTHPFSSPPSKNMTVRSAEQWAIQIITDTPGDDDDNVKGSDINRVAQQHKALVQKTMAGDVQRQNLENIDASLRVIGLIYKLNEAELFGTVIVALETRPIVKRKRSSSVLNKNTTTTSLSSKKEKTKKPPRKRSKKE